MKQAIQIETDLFIFETPEGWEIKHLDEEVELDGHSGEFMVISSYSLDEKLTPELTEKFKETISHAMNEAIQDPELTISRPLKSDKSSDNLPILSLLSQTSNATHEYFDQYAIINNTTAIIISVEGDLKNRSSSALVEEAIYDAHFK